MTNQIMLTTLLGLSLLACVATADNNNSIAESSENAPTSGLVFATETSEGCSLSFFNPKTAVSTTLAVVPECSGSLYVSSSSETAHYVLNSDLYYVNLDVEEAQLRKIPLPDDKFELYRASLDVRPSNHYFPPSEANRLNPFWVGTLSDGRLAAAMYIVMPADDEYRYLFVRKSNQWYIEDQRHCGSYESPCYFEKFEAEQSRWYEDHDRDIWSVESASNMYLTSAEFENIPGEYDTYFAERKLRFKVNNASAFVKVRGEHSQHGRGIYTYTVNVEFDDPEKNLIDILGCDISFFDRYLLVHPCRGPINGQVYDLETGEMVLDSLLHFGWLN